jgi:pyrroloquinoline quinone biosynthesis protein D
MTTSADAAGLPRRRTGIEVRRHGDRAVLVDATGAEVCEMNETALALWELCDGETRPEEIVIAICEAFAVPHDQAAEDVDRTLGELRAAGLLDDGRENGASNL